MEAIISYKDDEYFLEIGEDRMKLGGLSDQNIEEMLRRIYGTRRGSVQLILGSQGGLSPENIEQMIDALYKAGEYPTEIILTLEKE
jgi:hypothetical protein